MYVCMNCGKTAGVTSTMVCDDCATPTVPGKVVGPATSGTKLPPCSAGRATPDQVATRKAKVVAKGTVLGAKDHATLTALTSGPRTKQDLWTCCKATAKTLGAATRPELGHQGGGLIGRGLITAQVMPNRGGFGVMVVYTITPAGLAALGECDPGATLVAYSAGVAGGCSPTPLRCSPLRYWSARHRVQAP